MCISQDTLRCFATTYFLSWSCPPQFYDRLALNLGKDHIGKHIKAKSMAVFAH